jgi:hypothetical protein
MQDLEAALRVEEAILRQLETELDRGAATAIHYNVYMAFEVTRARVEALRLSLQVGRTYNPLESLAGV